MADKPQMQVKRQLGGTPWGAWYEGKK